MAKIKYILQGDPPQNRIMQFYLNSFRKRLDKTESRKRLLLAHIINLCYILIIFKYGISLVIDFDYEIKLYLYDLSMILGGIERYNKIFFICVWILGLITNFKFHLSCDPNIKQLLELFDEMSAKNKLFVNISDEYDYHIQNKVCKLTKILYKGMNIILIELGKFQIYFLS